MRNLKKFLALVLAMVMAFSLMLTANAANTAKDFDDAASITEEFVEAADVLTGMKVFQGDEEAATFRPGDTINRAEVAALIYRLATGDVDDVRSGAYANYGNFVDVSESDWFAGYVGYCANAGYIKGHDGYFNPYDSVTGYETLAMILRAIGYDKNHEFEGATWETNVSALATQLGILTNIKTTHYGNTLYLASRRDVVAELLFQADAKVPMVMYTPAFGYQQTGMDGGVVGSTTNPTLGEHIFGLKERKDGILLGNEQTGEGKDKSVLGYAGKATTYVNGAPIKDANGDAISIEFTAYAWTTTVDASAKDGTYAVAATGTGADAKNTVLGDNVKYELTTGIDLVGHKLRVWYDNGNGVVSNSNKHVYAYFDEATLTEVVTTTGDRTNPTAVNATATGGTSGKNLYDLAKDAGFSVSANTKAVFNNSFGKFGTDFSDADTKLVGDGSAVTALDTTGTNSAESPVKMYKLISNSSSKSLDAVISLNIESSQITESNAVNRVPTIGVPVTNAGKTNTATIANPPAANTDLPHGAQNQNQFIDADNVKQVPANGVFTGVIAKDALVGNSASALGDYEMGIHITGTTPREPSDDEVVAVKVGNVVGTNVTETAYFLLNKVTATVEGKVVAYNRNAGTVTLDNGTVLQRSKFYNTVVVTNPKNNASITATSVPKVSATQAPISAIPQGWVYDAGATMDAALDKWVEGYANTTYKFYTDYEGKYLGAERSYGASFLYGTYLDYDQKTSTSTFNYYLTGVNLNGEIETVPVSKYWAPTAATSIPSSGVAPTALTETNITGTNDLGVPFRDTYGSGTSATAVNGIGKGMYTGVAISNGTADFNIIDTNLDRNEYLNNMARLGIKYAAYDIDGTTANPAFAADIDIDKTSIGLGAEVTVAGGSRYLTEATKFILVEGFGTDSVKAEVYNGISELRGGAAHVFLNMSTASVDLDGLLAAKVAGNLMTYYTESPYTYAQSGATDMKIDTIILPKEAVTWSGGSGLYYVGNPAYSSINSWGTDAWKYTLYEDGEAREVWLTNDPSIAAGSGAAAAGNLKANYNVQLTKDSFLNLEDTGLKANDGEPIYTAGNYNTSGVFTAGAYVTTNNKPARVVDGTAGNNAGVCDTNQYTMATGANATGVRYSAVTRDAQTATFITGATGTTDATLYRVADAKVVNLNKGAQTSAGADLTDVNKCESGEIWPGITDLATLNEAGSIDPVTGRALKVAVVVDPNNPLVVTCIYVCWDQTFS